jgi:hypothetical protein
MGVCQSGDGTLTLIETVQSHCRRAVLYSTVLYSTKCLYSTDTAQYGTVRLRFVTKKTFVETMESPLSPKLLYAWIRVDTTSLETCMQYYEKKRSESIFKYYFTVGLSATKECQERTTNDLF